VSDSERDPETQIADEDERERDGEVDSESERESDLETQIADEDGSSALDAALGGVATGTDHALDAAVKLL
jgi:hypothetical protein